MNLEEGQERWIFSDYQTEKKLIGKVKLLELVKEGLTFILEDMPKEKQIVYGTQHWKCEIISSGSYYPLGSVGIFKIRYINNIGPITSDMDYNEDQELTEEEYLETQKIIDKFIEIDEEKCY